MVNFLHLRYFTVIANYQNISKAAEELMVAQPALSKVISSLEEELGVTLFKRDGKKLILNSYGETFLHTAKMILNLMDDSMNNLKNHHEVSGEIHIALHINCTEFFEDLGAFSACYPDVKVKLFSIRDLKGDPSRSNFSLAVLPGYEFQSFPHVICGERSVLYAVLSSNHPLANKKSIKLEELKDEYFAFLSPRDGRLDQTYNLCIDAGFTPKVRYIAYDTYYMQYLTTFSNAISLAFNTNATFFKGRKDTAVVPISDVSRIGRKIGLCLTSDTPTHLERVFWEFVKDRHTSV